MNAAARCQSPVTERAPWCLGGRHERLELRELDRRRLETGSVEDDARWILARIRAGRTRPDRVKLAARLGHAPSAVVLGCPVGPPVRPLRSFVAGLTGRDFPAAIWIGHAVVSALEHVRARPVLDAVEGWLRDPDPERVVALVLAHDALAPHASRLGAGSRAYEGTTISPAWQPAGWNSGLSTADIAACELAVEAICGALASAQVGSPLGALVALPTWPVGASAGFAVERTIGALGGMTWQVRSAARTSRKHAVRALRARILSAAVPRLLEAP